MSQLIVIEDRKPERITASDEATKAIRRQAEAVLKNHSDELSPETITMLKSPFIHIVNMTLAELKPWLIEQVAASKENKLRNHPDYETVRDLLARGNFVLTGEFGDIVKSKIHRDWQRQVLEMDTLEILRTNQLKGLEIAVKLAERIERAEKAAVSPKPQPPKNSRRHTKGKRPVVTKDPILRVITAEEPRERKPKAKKPTYTGLPPVQVDVKVDWDKQQNIKAADKGYRESRVAAGIPQRGKAVHNPKNHNKGKKQG